MDSKAEIRKLQLSRGDVVSCIVLYLDGVIL